MKTIWRDFTNGLFGENPLLRLMIGLCSALAVSWKAENAVFLGLAATFVLVASNILISMLRRATPDQIRIPIFIVVIASFVTIVDLTMRAYFPTAYERLGVWIPLIVVNCIILGRAEAFAYRHGVLRSMADGLGMGAGYTVVLLMMGVIRELFGTGRLAMFGSTLVSFGPAFDPPRIMVAFPGAFFVFGVLIGLHDLIFPREK